MKRGTGVVRHTLAGQRFCLHFARHHRAGKVAFKIDVGERAIEFTVDPDTGLAIAIATGPRIPPLPDAVASRNTGNELALVATVVAVVAWKEQDAKTVKRSIDELAFIAGPVVEILDTQAVRFAIDGLSQVAVALEDKGADLGRFQFASLTSCIAGLCRTRLGSSGRSPTPKFGFTGERSRLFSANYDVFRFIRHRPQRREYDESKHETGHPARLSARRDQTVHAPLCGVKPRPDSRGMNHPDSLGPRWPDPATGPIRILVYRWVLFQICRGSEKLKTLIGTGQKRRSREPPRALRRWVGPSELPGIDRSSLSGGLCSQGGEAARVV